MKFVVLLGLFLTIVAQSQSLNIPAQYQTNEFIQFINRGRQLGKECGEELGPEKVRNTPDVTGLLQYPEDNDSLNAIWGCIFKKKGIVDEDSNIYDTQLQSYAWEIFTSVGRTTPFYEEAARDLVNHCNSVKGEDYGQTAVMLQNCVVRYSYERNLRK